ncbi:MAG TPA: histidine phosphatase family protein [Acidimicrobiales bacterium]|nr:histidine phosphatase family protein [Acidimicrobiales bacterium]
MRTRLLIVQHAEKAALPGDPGLSEAGMAQADWVAATLTSVPVAAVYSSPLRRARQTAEPIGRRLGLAVAVDGRLAERMNWDGRDKSLQEFLADWDRASRQRDFTPPGGQSSRAAGERLGNALVEFAARHPGETVVVVSHGGVTADLARNILGDHEVSMMAPGVIEGGIPNCAITEIVAEPAALQVRSLAAPTWDPTS